MREEAFGVLKILYQYYFFLKLRRAQLADTADKYLRLRLHTDSANFQYYNTTLEQSLPLNGGKLSRYCISSILHPIQWHC